MDGEQPLAGLLKLRANLSVIMGTGYGESRFAQRLKQQGGAGFIEKPFSLPDLMKRVTAVKEACAPSVKG